MAGAGICDTHRFIRLDLAHTAPGSPNSSGYYEDFHYIDLAREMSAMNSRLYRQGMMYHVANITIHDTFTDSWVKVCTLPCTWPVKMAWRTAAKNYIRMLLQLPQDIRRTAMRAATYHDFRIYFNADHVSDPDTPSFTDIEGGNIRRSEYEYTKFTSTDGGSPDEFTVHMMGEHDGAPGGYVSVCALEAYEEILIAPPLNYEEADFATGVWSNLVEQETVSDDLLDDLSDDYDLPPYDQYVFPGAQDGGTKNSIAPWSVRETHVMGDTSPMSAVGGFPAPCGLLCIETSSRADDDNLIGLIIELVPGSYKGIKAESLGGYGRTKWKQLWNKAD